VLPGATWTATRPVRTNHAHIPPGRGVRFQSGGG